MRKILIVLWLAVFSTLLLPIIATAGIIENANYGSVIVRYGPSFLGGPDSGHAGVVISPFYGNLNKSTDEIIAQATGYEVNSSKVTYNVFMGQNQSYLGQFRTINPPSDSPAFRRDVVMFAKMALGISYTYFNLFAYGGEIFLHDNDTSYSFYLPTDFRCDGLAEWSVEQASYISQGGAGADQRISKAYGFYANNNPNIDWPIHIGYYGVDDTAYTLTIDSDSPSSGVPITVSVPDSLNQKNGTTGAGSTLKRLYTHDTPVELTAPVTAPNGYVFSTWWGCTAVNGGTLDLSARTCTTSMKKAAHFKAYYVVPSTTSTSTTSTSTTSTTTSVPTTSSTTSVSTTVPTTSVPTTLPTSSSTSILATSSTTSVPATSSTTSTIAASSTTSVLTTTSHPSLSSPVTVATDGGQQPRIKKRGNNIYVLNGGNNRNLMFYKSADNGTTFASTILATPVLNSYEYEFSMDTNGYLYAIWESANDHQMYIRRSFDGGITWSFAASVASGFTWMDNPSCYFSNGTLYLLFRGDKNSKVELYLTKSTDYGNTFSTPVQVTNNTTPEDSGEIAVFGNNVYAVYFDTSSASPYNIYLIASLNSGSSFGSPVLVNRTSGKSDSGPSVGVDGAGNIFVAYSDKTSDGEGDLYVTKSMNGGSSFNYVSAADSTYRQQGYPRIFIDANDYINLLWNDNRDNTSYGSVYYTRSINDGASYETNVNIRSSGGISNGSLYVDSDIVYIVVTDYNTSPFSTIFYKLTWLIDTTSTTSVPTTIPTTSVRPTTSTSSVQSSSSTTSIPTTSATTSIFTTTALTTSAPTTTTVPPTTTTMTSTSTTTISLVPDISMTPAPQLSFLNILAGTTAEQTLTIKSVGTGSVNISSIPHPVPTSPFAIKTDSCSNVTLAPNQSCTIALTFTSATAGFFNSTLSIPSNDLHDSHQNVGLIASATSANNHSPNKPTPISPANGANNMATIVDFVWAKCADADGHPISYRVYIDTDLSFTGRPPEIILASSGTSNMNFAGVGSLVGLLSAIALIRGRKSRRQIFTLVSILLVISVLLGSCGGAGSDGGGSSNSTTSIPPSSVTKTVNGLTPSSTYYWKVVADDGQGGVSESDTYNFKTL